MSDLVGYCRKSFSTLFVYIFFHQRFAVKVQYTAYSPEENIFIKLLLTASVNATFKLFELTFQMSYQNYPLITFLHEKMEKLIPKIYMIL